MATGWWTGDASSWLLRAVSPAVSQRIPNRLRRPNRPPGGRPSRQVFRRPRRGRTVASTSLSRPRYRFRSYRQTPEQGAIEPDERRIRNLAREEVAVDESLSATYRLPESVPEGTHKVWGTVGVSWTDADTDQRYPFQVSLTVDE